MHARSPVPVFLAASLAVAACATAPRVSAPAAPTWISLTTAVHGPWPKGSAATGGLAGRFVDDHGTPLFLATIVVQVPGLGEQTELSDADGRFVIADLPPGRLDVQVSYGETQRLTVPIEAGHETWLASRLDTSHAPPPFVMHCAPPPILGGHAEQGTRLGAGDLRHLPSRSRTWDGHTDPPAGPLGY